MSNLPSLSDVKNTLFNTISRNKEILTGVVTGASETSRLVINATNNEQWGPTGPQMRQIADLTFNYSDCTQVMEGIWDRLETDITFGANWRNIYKTLLLLDYVVRNGSERVVNEARQNIYQIKSLSAVHFVDSEGTDRGLSIRERAKQVVEILGDTVRLRDERKKCKQNRDKYTTAYGNESHDRPYRPSHTTFDEEEYSSRRPTTKSSFNLTEDDFKDDADYRPSGKAAQRKEEIDDDFAPSPTPQPQRAKTTPPNPTKPVTNLGSHVNPNPTPAAPAPWDPFELSHPTPTPANPNNWDDFNPRGPNTSTNPLDSLVFANISQPMVGNPTNPTNPNTSLPPNLFAIPSTNNPTMPPGNNFNNPTQPKSTNTVTPLKSNDPWAASHLFNLSNNPSSPRSNSVNTATGKPLGATVGSGWPNSGTTTTTMPPANAPTYAYPPNMAYNGVPVTYATYPVSSGTNPTLYTTTPVNYSNTSQWGI